LETNRIFGVFGVDQGEIVRWNRQFVLGLEGPDGFELLRGEGQEISQLPNRADGVLGLPPPIVPLFVGNVAPERVTPWFTGRFFFLDPTGSLGDRPGNEPGALIRFTHRFGCLQLDSDIQYPCSTSWGWDSPAGGSTPYKAAWYRELPKIQGLPDPI